MKRAVLIFVGAAIMLMGVVGVASAQNMGVGLTYQGANLVPDLSLPIKMSGGSIVIEPLVGFSIVSVDTPDNSSQAASANSLAIEGTQFRFGASIEKQTNPGGTSPLFGGFARVNLTSPESDALDSWTDISFGAFIGGTAQLADNLEFLGFWGPQFTLNGERTSSSGSVLAASSTSIDSMAGFRLRWYVFGS